MDDQVTTRQTCCRPVTTCMQFFFRQLCNMQLYDTRRAGSVIVSFPAASSVLRLSHDTHS